MPRKIRTHEQLTKSFLIPTLRRASLRWYARNQAYKDARLVRGVYICAGCKEQVGRKEIIVDHINPVVPVDKGFTNWHDYIIRMFCEPAGFQILCNKCADKKTEEEDALRERYADTKKKRSS